MTIRRNDREHDEEEDLMWTSDDDPGDLFTVAQTSPPPSEIPPTSPSKRGRACPVPTHPVLTNFGPQTLTSFLREQIEEAKVEGQLGKGKGKARERNPERFLDRTTRRQSRQDPSQVSRSSISHKSKEKDARPQGRTRLEVTEDALKRLRGESNIQNPLGPNNTTQGHKSSDVVGESRADWSSTTTQNVAASGMEQGTQDIPFVSRWSKAHSTARSTDFTNHAGMIRDRGRRGELRRLTHAPTTRVQDIANLSDYSPPRFRKTSESLAHLSPQRTKRSRSTTLRKDGNSLKPEDSSISPSHVEASDLSDHDGIDQPDGSTHSNWLAGQNRGRIADLSETENTDAVAKSHLRSSDPASPARNQHQRKDVITYHTVLQETEQPTLQSSTADQGKVFDYSQIVPEQIPRLVPISLDRPSSEGRHKAYAAAEKFMNQPVQHSTTITDENWIESSDEEPREVEPRRRSKRTTKRLQLIGESSDRVWQASFLPQSSKSPPVCEVDPDSEAANSAVTGLMLLNIDLWTNVADYLSAQDVRNLRRSCSVLANELAPLMLRSVVGRFEKSMFGLSDGNSSQRGSFNTSNSVLSKYGEHMHRFGIAFDYDLHGLCLASPKVTEKQEDAWYGSYRWPTAKYPRFNSLRELEDLVDDNRPLLKDSFLNLKNVSELALSLDSGHGWLEGPDISDLAIFEQRTNHGTKVFGQAFDTEDVWHAFGRNEYFKWAQQNSINETLKGLANKTDALKTRRSIRELRKTEIRDFDSFRDEIVQHDFDETSHTGGQATQQQQAQNQQHNIAMANLQLGHVLPNAMQMQTLLAQAHLGGQVPSALRRRLHRMVVREAQTERNREDQRKRRESTNIPPQWPLIFNGHNVAADVGGSSNNIQHKMAVPTSFPLLPGQLSEAQAQWLMETVWAQRAFLSAYTTAIIHHKQMLRGVQALTIAKLSSGLLPSLAQREFWTALPSLRKLKILISPDWRTEHMPGDKFHATHMSISPLNAANKFTDFLQVHVAKLEKLSHLTVGYAGGGEHAIGMFARNQHVLPAPITNEPRTWVTNHLKQPSLDSICKFDHIRDLTFENCWFSPCMLEGLMEKSRDTSLHTLVLDSVSMLSRHSTGIDGPLSTIRNGLHCKYEEVDWLHEELPTSACWVDVLDKITSGQTMMDRKFEAGLLDTDINPSPQREFRGNVQKIVLKSCGYAKVSGLKGDDFNQNSLVVQIHQSIDEGLVLRKARFEKLTRLSVVSPPTTDGNNTVRLPSPIRNPAQDRRRAAARESGDKPSKDGPIMMGMSDTNGQEWFGLGTLTQCVHPVEKRVLEQAWGMQFGWGNDIKRWASVEDGFFEGGTGRFSGVVLKDDADAASA